LLSNNIPIYNLNQARCNSAGAHFNPTGVNHGDISDTVRHVGDYGNVYSDPNGLVNVLINDTLSQLYGINGIIGRSIVLHQNIDDLGRGNNQASSTAGNSGPKIACGVIGLL
jgi:Cu-Zn family superoxide dismutase